MRVRYFLALCLAISALGFAWAKLRTEESVCGTLLSRAPTTSPRLVYVKADHQLCLIDRAGVVWERSASHGRAVGKKRFEGDERTPEGLYMLSPARASQRFGVFMAISYPNAGDARTARASGRKAGDGVGIHGPQRWYAFVGEAQALLDHSDGCIVVDAEGMSELAQRIIKATPIDILAALPAADGVH